MKRRAFMTILGGTAVTWPLATRAQDARMRRIGVLLFSSENDPGGKAQFASFKLAISQAGWIDGRNVRMDIRWPLAIWRRWRYSPKSWLVCNPT
jgi:putative ABC transport system substrate-binding protein